MLIAGKGHEQYQLSQEGKRFFDDTLEAKKALAAWRLEDLKLATKGMLTSDLQRAAGLGAVVTDSRKVAAGAVAGSLKRPWHLFQQLFDSRTARRRAITLELSARKGEGVP